MNEFGGNWHYCWDTVWTTIRYMDMSCDHCEISKKGPKVQGQALSRIRFSCSYFANAKEQMMTITNHGRVMSERCDDSPFLIPKWIRNRRQEDDPETICFTKDEKATMERLFKAWDDTGTQIRIARAAQLQVIAEFERFCQEVIKFYGYHEECAVYGVTGRDGNGILIGTEPDGGEHKHQSGSDPAGEEW